MKNLSTLNYLVATALVTIIMLLIYTTNENNGIPCVGDLPGDH